nr:hypothetical protein [Angustibacter aerolatus]
MITSIRRRQGDEGFTLIEAPRRHDHHRHPRRGGHPGVPVAARQGAGHGDEGRRVEAWARSLATYWIDGAAAPTVTVAAGRYLVGTNDVGKASNSVTVKTTNVVDSAHWCLALQNTAGSTQVWKYSARSGLGSGDCAAADVA